MARQSSAGFFCLDVKDEFHTVLRSISVASYDISGIYYYTDGEILVLTYDDASGQILKNTYQSFQHIMDAFMAEVFKCWPLYHDIEATLRRLEIEKETPPRRRERIRRHIKYITGRWCAPIREELPSLKTSKTVLFDMLKIECPDGLMEERCTTLNRNYMVSQPNSLATAPPDYDLEMDIFFEILRELMTSDVNFLKKLTIGVRMSRGPPDIKNIFYLEDRIVQQVSLASYE